jgi:acyl-CoA thioester hydrolase
MGYLHHAKYLTYFEIGRTDMFRASGGNYRALEESGNFVVVVRADIRYRRPARYDDVLIVRTTLKSVTMAKIVHQYQLRRDEQLLATAEVTLALIDRSGRAQRIPQWMQDLV